MPIKNTSIAGKKSYLRTFLLFQKDILACSSIFYRIMMYVGTSEFQCYYFAIHRPPNDMAMIAKTAPGITMTLPLLYRSERC